MQSLGDILGGVTLSRNSLMTGPGCTLQGFLINCGDVASAIWSFVIALHTFTLLAGGRKWGGWVAEKTASGKTRWVVCLGLWCFVFLIGAIGPVVFERLKPENGPYCIFSFEFSLIKTIKSDLVGVGLLRITTWRELSSITACSCSSLADFSLSLH